MLYMQKSRMAQRTTCFQTVSRWYVTKARPIYGSAARSKKGGTRTKLKFEAVDNKLFNKVVEQLISALDRVPPTVEVTKKN